MPKRSNYGSSISLLVVVCLLQSAIISLASPQENLVFDSVIPNDFVIDISSATAIQNHSFIAESSDTVSALLTFKAGSSPYTYLADSRFDGTTIALPEIDTNRKIHFSLSDYSDTLKADCELMRNGFKEYFPDTFSRKWSMFEFIVYSFRIEQTMLRTSASLWFTDYLEASASMWAEGIGRTTRIDLKVTIRRIPLFKQARLVSRYFQVSSPRSMWHEPWLERGYKFNVGDISLSEGRFVSNLELQFPEILGGRGIVGALSLNADRGLGLGFNIDLPNYTIPGTSFKLKLPDISFVLFH